MSNPAIAFVKEHPAGVALGAVGVVVLFMLMRGGGNSAGDSGAAVSAYYNAVAQQNAAGSAVQIAQIQTNAATNQALIAASYGLETNKTWADNSLAIAQSNNATAVEHDINQRNMGIDALNWRSNDLLSYNTAVYRLRSAGLDPSGLVPPAQ